MPPIALERSVGDREGYILRQTLFEKPAVNQVQPGLGQDAGIVGKYHRGNASEKTASSTAGGKGMGDTLGWTQPHT